MSSSSPDWPRLRPFITELYQNQRMTMNQVCHHLNAAGYRVTTRMVRGRITQWNLHRNHQLRDMTAALRLLDLNPDAWPSLEPRFQIRGQLVTMREITRFFRRKGIQSPLHWAHSTGIDCKGSHVMLLAEGQDLKGETYGLQGRSKESSAVRILGLRPNRPTRHLLTLDENAVSSLQEYCSSYIGVGYVLHEEPQVHQFTNHGQFGEWMRDGLAHMMRKSPDAFPKFNRGFELIRTILLDCHPMALAQYLSVVCILAAHQADSVLSSLLRYVAMMTCTLDMAEPAARFLTAIHSSQNVLGTAILSLRSAVGVFAEQHSISWQKFYIQERLCDCLYYGKAYGEGSVYRARLFLEQEMLYGPLARNVLYTLTNVASDHIYGGDIDGAQAGYLMVLERAEGLAGLGRAKIRFTALEGLAESAQIRFENAQRGHPSLTGEPIILHLQDAFSYIQEALREAQMWFEQSNRRTLRALERRAQIVRLLGNVAFYPT
ncbi:hypothetical protein IQ07DRAFT_525203 [Pyrenochaeta sp. DS3sAY3a]|nr:hypothetical protein IQ07DRAFT_525203 [Pyrenochaeta sp. DS3sAY3a]